MPDITDEQIDDCMREAGMEEIEEADYRHGQGEQMTISEQERLDTARKFARLVLALRPSGRKEECCILKVAATRDGMKCSRGVLGCVAVHDEDVPAASAAPVEPSLFLRMVDGFYARTELEEWFHDIFEDDEYLTFEEMIFDDYDSSIELLGCLPDLRLKPEHQQALWDQGVATIWLNHKDGMQTRYTKPNYSYYNPTGPDGVRYPQPDRQKTRASPPPPTEESGDRLCQWTYEGDDTGAWSTACGQMHAFTDGGPTENSHRFCCYCGGRLGITEAATPLPEPDSIETSEADAVEPCAHSCRHALDGKGLAPQCLAGCRRAGKEGRKG